MIRSTCLLLALLPCLLGCQRDEAATPSAAQATPAPSTSAPAPQGSALTPPRTDSELIHQWRLPDLDKYTCAPGYRTEIIPFKERQHDKPLLRCRSITNPALPTKPVIVKSP